MRPLQRPSHGVVAGYAGLLLGTIALAGGPALAAGLVNGHSIKRGTVTSTKLAKHAVTASKIRAGAVTRSKLATGAVTSAALATGAVTGAHVRDQSLGVADLSIAARAALSAGPTGAGSVTTMTIVNGAVTADKLAAGSVTGDKLAAGSVQTAAVSDGSITAAKLAAGVIGPVTVADGSITAAKLADGAAGGAKIPALVVTAPGHVNSLGSTVVPVSCSAGKQALGGGAAVAEGAFPTGVGSIVPVVTVSAPTFGVDNVPTGWTAKVRNANTTLGADFTVYVICA